MSYSFYKLLGMQLEFNNSFLAKTVLDDDVIGLTPLKVGRYPIRAIEDEQYEVAKSKATICYLTSQELEQIIKSKAAVIVNE
jgi:hypothetical protein